MKLPQLLLVFLFCFSTISIAQNYKIVDSIVSNYPSSYSKPERLAKQITTDFSSDLDKVRAVYYWITNNVAYDYEELKSESFSYSSKEEYLKKQEALKQKKATRVISKGKAICDGYSTAFLVLCENLNIEARYISGAAKTYVKDIGRSFKTDHAWNIVVIDNQEYLIDTTWGAGHYNTGFVKEFNDSYFLMNPKQFIKKHYPKEYKNTLLKEKISVLEFLDAPLIYSYNFELISPQKGTIKKGSKGRLVKFKFLTDEEIGSISYKIGNQTTHDIKFTKDKYLEFSIYISNETKGRELTVFFDYDAVIGYKLQ